MPLSVRNPLPMEGSTGHLCAYPSGMLELHDDEGLSISRLFGIAWGLSLAAAVAWVVLMIRLDEHGSWNTTTGFALAVAVTCSVFSACCAVIVAIKSSEARVRHELRRLNAPST